MYTDIYPHRQELLHRPNIYEIFYFYFILYMKHII